MAMAASRECRCSLSADVCASCWPPKTKNLDHRHGMAITADGFGTIEYDACPLSRHWRARKCNQLEPVLRSKIWRAKIEEVKRIRRGSRHTVCFWVHSWARESWWRQRQWPLGVGNDGGEGERATMRLVDAERGLVVRMHRGWLCCRDGVTGLAALSQPRQSRVASMGKRWGCSGGVVKREQ
jgi:hypothetical protein